MDKLKSVPIYKFTKDEGSHVIELPENHTEILGVNNDFIIIGGKTIEFEIRDDVLGIFIKNKSSEIIAKKFIRDFEADSKLELVQYFYGNDSCSMYFFRLINKGEVNNNVI